MTYYTHLISKITAVTAMTMYTKQNSNNSGNRPQNRRVRELQIRQRTDSRFLSSTVIVLSRKLLPFQKVGALFLINQLIKIPPSRILKHLQIKLRHHRQNMVKDIRLNTFIICPFLVFAEYVDFDR